MSIFQMTKTATWLNEVRGTVLQQNNLTSRLFFYYMYCCALPVRKDTSIVLAWARYIIHAHRICAIAILNCNWSYIHFRSKNIRGKKMIIICNSQRPPDRQCVMHFWKCTKTHFTFKSSNIASLHMFYEYNNGKKRFKSTNSLYTVSTLPLHCRLIIILLLQLAALINGQIFY